MEEIGNRPPDRVGHAGKTMSPDRGGHTGKTLSPDHRGHAGETIYPVKELCAAHEQQFGCSREMVMAAFLQSGRTEATLAEAKELVEQFRKQEVG